MTETWKELSSENYFGKTKEDYFCRDSRSGWPATLKICFVSKMKNLVNIFPNIFSFFISITVSQSFPLLSPFTLSLSSSLFVCLSSSLPRSSFLNGLGVVSFRVTYAWRQRRFNKPSSMFSKSVFFRFPFHQVPK